jgi:cysteinyl-tRNA synthetase
MDDDFNTANAITALQATIKLTNQNIRKPNNLELLNQAYLTLKYMIDILGLRISVNRIEKDDRIIYKNWQNARKSKNFEEADRLRKTLVEKGVL